MESTYTTKQGDVWDKIAYEVYGDEEYTGWLMENNFPLLDTFVFDAGVVLQTPTPPEQTAANDLPIPFSALPLFRRGQGKMARAQRSS